MVQLTTTSFKTVEIQSSYHRRLWKSSLFLLLGLFFIFPSVKAQLVNYCQPTGGACGGSPKYLRGIKLTSNTLNQLMYNSTNNLCTGYGTFSGNSNDGITPLVT